VKDPKTPGQWRSAAALAEACVRLDAARQYGLITGGPRVNVERCLALLAAAGERGIVLTPTEIDDAVTALVREAAGVVSVPGGR